MKKVQSVKQQKLQTYHLIKRNKAGEVVRQEKSKTVVDNKLKTQSNNFALKNKLQLIQKVMLKYLN